MDSAKRKVRQIILQYRRDYAEEYSLLKEALVIRRKMIREGIDATEGSDMMPMYELSENLQTFIILALEPEELTWWKTREGGRWFIKTFPVFSLQHGI